VPLGDTVTNGLPFKGEFHCVAATGQYGRTPRLTNLGRPTKPRRPALKPGGSFREGRAAQRSKFLPLFLVRFDSEAYPSLGNARRCRHLKQSSPSVTQLQRVALRLWNPNSASGQDGRASVAGIRGFCEEGHVIVAMVANWHDTACRLPKHLDHFQRFPGNVGHGLPDAGGPGLVPLNGRGKARGRDMTFLPLMTQRKGLTEERKSNERTGALGEVLCRRLP
jgi:hypothetical protein